MQNKSKVELADLVKTLNARNSEIISKGEAETRKLTEDEEKELAENKAKIDEVNAELNKRNNTSKVMSDTKTNLSLARLIRSAITREELPEEYNNIINLGREQMRAVDGYDGHSLVIPNRQIRTASTVTTTLAANTIETNLLDIIEPVYDELVATKLGVRKLTGLKGNVQLPTATSVSAAWASETGDATQVNPTFGKKTLTPNRLAACMYVSMEMLQQDTLDVDNLLRRMLVEAISQKLEDTIFGADAAETNVKPAGIFYGATSQAISVDNIYAITKAAKEANIRNAKWLINPAVEATLKATYAGGSHSDVKAIYDPSLGMLDGAEVIVSNKAAGYALGDWSGAVLGQWGGITLTPQTQAKSGTIELVVNSWWDFQVPVASKIKAYTVPTSDAE